MPLSEHEQRLLDEIEQALYAEDPKFASSVRSARSRPRVRNSVLLCAIGFVVGLVLILVGLLNSDVLVLSVVGFVFVVAASGFFAQSLRNRTSTRGRATASGSRPVKHNSMRTRMEDRMRRRFDQN